MIDTQAIRSKILDLAMRGQLTEQLPADGSAEELYQRIQKEKEALIAKKKIKKEKILPSVTKDEELYSIPETWKWVRLGDLTTKISSGSTPTGGRKSDVYVLEGYPFFREQNIYNDGIHRKGMVFITEELLNSRKNSVVIAKDILLNITGGSIGRCALIPDNFSKGSINQHILIIRMVEPALRRYIHRCICAPFAQSYIKDKAVGDKDGFSGGRCKKMLIPLPPLEEQKRIVEKIHQAFSVLDTIDELQKQYAANLSALKSKLIDAAIQGKLTEQLPEDGDVESLYAQVLQGKEAILKERKGRKDKNIKEISFDVPYDIPSRWKWIRLGEIGLFKKGPFGSALTKSMFVPKSSETVKVYEQQHAIKKNPTLGTYYITKEYFENKLNGFEVKPGDIIISCAGTIGETYVMPNDIEQGIINQALMRVTLSAGINKRFFQYYFDANLKSSARAGNGSAIINIPPFDVIKNWYFPLAPIEEQERIVERLDEVLKEIEV